MIRFNYLYVAILLTVTVVSYALNWTGRWKYRKFPGPKPQVLFGNAIEVRRKKSFVALTDWGRQYGDVFRIFFVRQPVIVLTDPHLVRQVTIKDFSKFHDRVLPASSISPPLFGGNRLKATQASIVMASGGKWGSLRAAFQPMFHSQPLHEYAATINAAVDKLLANLAEIAKSGQEVDMHRQLGRLTMEVIGAAAFGVKFETQSAAVGEDIPLIEAAKAAFLYGGISSWTVFVMLMPKITWPALKLLAQMFPDKSMEKAKFASNVVHDACDHLVENSRKAYNGSSAKPADWTWFKRDPDCPYKDLVPAENSIISMLQQANNKATGTGFDPMDIAAQANIVILAGYETTANTLSYCIYLLSKTPAAEQQLLREVDSFKGKPGYDDLDKFPYTRAVVNEALRLYPPGAILARTASQDVQLGRWHIPKNTMVQINLWGMHHDERWWQDADSFKPGRWLKDKTGGDRSGGLAYLPFGLGPRNCVGMKLALEEATIALVRLYQKFSFTLTSQLRNSSLELRQGITVSPKDGIKAKVNLR